MSLLKLAALANPNEASYQDLAPAYSPPPSDALPAAGAALGLAASIPGARMMGEANVRRQSPAILGGMRDEAIQHYNQGLASQNQMIARERNTAADSIRSLDAQRQQAEKALLANRERAQGGGMIAKLRNNQSEKRCRKSERLRIMARIRLMMKRLLCSV